MGGTGRTVQNRTSEVTEDLGQRILLFCSKLIPPKPLATLLDIYRSETMMYVGVQPQSHGLSSNHRLICLTTIRDGSLL